MAVWDSFKLTDLLKVSGLQAFAVAATCWIVLYLPKTGMIGPLESWVTLLLVVVGILATILSVLLFGQALIRLLNVPVHWNQWRRRRREQKAVADYIDHMNDHEREIIGYLLARNQKSFTCASDGGHASTLLGRGIVIYALNHGQHYDLQDTPVTIPDHVWDVLKSRNNDLPDTYTGTAHPWRVAYF